MHDMTITQAWSTYVDGHGSFQDHWQIIGLGDDNKVYMWSQVFGAWELFQDKELPSNTTRRNSDDPINLDDIPF